MLREKKKTTSYVLSKHDWRRNTYINLKYIYIYITVLMASGHKPAIMARSVSLKAFIVLL